MHEFTQRYYDDIMNYVGLNQRAMGLLAPTKYTGLVRWHKRNHEVYDHINEKITKYIGNMYDEYATPKSVSTYNYTINGDILTHIKAWKSSLEPMMMSTYEMYSEACKIGDFILADKFKCLNMIVTNEVFALKRLIQRLTGASQDAVMYVNKIIHDYFESSPDCKEIDLSL